MSENIKIGNNVTIGAMSFINKNIPDNCTVFTEKINRTIVKNN
ncbi:serine acetyltransferase [Erwinia endophytica]